MALVAGAVALQPAPTTGAAPGRAGTPPTNLPVALAGTFDPGRLSFSIAVPGVATAWHRSDYERLAVPVRPGETLELEPLARRPGEGAPRDPAGAPLPTGRAQFALAATGGTVTVRGAGSWSWRAAPAPGTLATITIERVDTGETMRLAVFVMVPASAVQGGALEGYRIDAYPSEPLRGNPIYLPPDGFVEVTSANLDTRVSPHFTLRQFICKQSGGYPKYVVLEPSLLLKLEVLLERANAAGIRTDTFAVLSGYRTPFYNRAIENTLYSRHQWGDAADIYVDVDGDGAMDDLDRNGRVDVADAERLYRFIEGFSGEPWYRELEGGLGLYAPSPARGPFVHVDVRGSKARWSA